MASAQETIAACSLFAGMPEKDRRRLAHDLHERHFADGEVITSQDTGGIAFFLLGEGTVAVTVNDVEQARLGPGDTFGEIGLLTGAKRSATLVAHGDVQCWTLSQWLFKPLLIEQPDFTLRLLEKLAHRLAAAGG